MTDLVDIVLYTSHCPNCLKLERLLKAAKIVYRVEDNKEKMLEMGMDELPVLGVGPLFMPYKEAVETVVSYIKVESEAKSEK